MSQTNPNPPFTPELIAQLRAPSTSSPPSASRTSNVSAMSSTFTLNDSDYIARQGEAARFYWILLKGRARILQNHPDGREITHHVYEAGSSFGELPLLANIPNAISIQCIEPCELLQFDENQFWNLMTTCSPLVRKAILGEMAFRFQKYQSIIVRQEKVMLARRPRGRPHARTKQPRRCRWSRRRPAPPEPPPHARAHR